MLVFLFAPCSAVQPGSPSRPSHPCWRSNSPSTPLPVLCIQETPAGHPTHHQQLPCLASVALPQTIEPRPTHLWALPQRQHLQVGQRAELADAIVGHRLACKVQLLQGGQLRHVRQALVPHPGVAQVQVQQAGQVGQGQQALVRNLVTDESGENILVM